MAYYKRQLSSRMTNAPRNVYYCGKLLEGLLKGAKMDGCKPLFSARLRKLLSISPKYI
jgi:hypothetical protein